MGSGEERAEDFQLPDGVVDSQALARRQLLALLCRGEQVLDRPHGMTIPRMVLRLPLVRAARHDLSVDTLAPVARAARSGLCTARTLDGCPCSKFAFKNGDCRAHEGLGGEPAAECSALADLACAIANGNGASTPVGRTARRLLQIPMGSAGEDVSPAAGIATGRSSPASSAIQRGTTGACLTSWPGLPASLQVR